MLPPTLCVSDENYPKALDLTIKKSNHRNKQIIIWRPYIIEHVHIYIYIYICIAIVRTLHIALLRSPTAHSRQLNELDFATVQYMLENVFEAAVDCSCRLLALFAFCSAPEDYVVCLSSHGVE